MAEYATYRGRGGGLHNFRLPLLPAFAEQVEKGWLVLVGEAPSPAKPEPRIASVEDAQAQADALLDTARDLSDQVAVDVVKPKHVDPKASWVAYAVSQGMTEDDAKAMTKAELFERYGH